MGELYFYEFLNSLHKLDTVARCRHQDQQLHGLLVEPIRISKVWERFKGAVPREEANHN
jgi:hypothetical protein